MKPLLHTPQYTQKHHIGVNEGIPLLDLTDLGVQGRIEFPDLPGYGEDHGEKTAKLCLVILSHEFPEENIEANQRVLWVASLFHDIGRAEPFGKPDHGHADRSARMAEEILRNSEVWADDALRGKVCRLIAKHSDPPGSDPLAVTLHDADLYESVRIHPNTSEGLNYMRARLGPNRERCITPWARDKAHLKRYMDFRGW